MTDKDKEYKKALFSFLKRALYVGIPQEEWVTKNKITVIWQDKDKSIYTWQINANTYRKNMKSIAVAIHRVLCKKYKKEYKEILWDRT